jgi:hypothetical protein
MVVQPGKYQRPQYQSTYTVAEKAVSAAVYIPALMGFLIGIVYILAKGPGCDQSFFRFHFYQSVFLSVCMFIVQGIASGMSGVLIGIIQLLAGVIGQANAVWLSENLLVVGLILQAPFILLLPYGAIMALLGKTTNIPWVSGLIRSNMAGR